MRILINLQMRLIMKIKSDKRRHNMLISNEVAVFILNKLNKFCFRDIVLAERRVKRTASYFARIEYFNSVYLSLHYMLFFSFE